MRIDKNSMSSRIRNSEVGQVLTFPIEKYSSVRATVSLVKIQYGTNYQIRYDRDEKMVYVERIS
ncbi:MAG: hypothetical protein LUC24_00670 [Bacteroidales bacterium]|nr:hypothetical protein [Bacteroidales bacterium]